jgi:hypothetical protein
MNRTAMHVKISHDARELLEKWSTQNLTNMTAEIVRSIRERDAREQREQRARA